MIAGLHRPFEDLSTYSVRNALETSAEQPISDRATVSGLFTVERCRDSGWFRGNGLKSNGTDRPFQRPKEALGSLIAP